jgi:general secretion pathway protein G
VVKRYFLILATLAIAAVVSSCSFLNVCTLSPTQARELVLKQDLFTMRSLISQYVQDKHRLPASLNDLVSAGYLKLIPVDPMTRKSDWIVEPEQDTPNQQEGSIEDVHSASTATGRDRTAYTTW